MKRTKDWFTRCLLQEKEIIELCNKGISCSQIDRELNLKKNWTWKFINKKNISTSYKRGFRSSILSKKQLELLHGCLLGDGSLVLSRKCKNPYFSCEHSIKQKEYAFWKFKILESLDAKYKEYIRVTPDRRNGKFYEASRVSIGSLVEFLPIYKNLYIGKKKRITKEFLENFSELSLAIMFMDDGNKLGNSIKISTCCFSEEDLEIFINFCKTKWDIIFNLHTENKLYLPVKYYSKFKSLIINYIHPTMLYKLP